MGASGQPILALRAQNRPLSAQSKPDCTEIGVAKTVDQTFLKCILKDQGKVCEKVHVKDNSATTIDKGLVIGMRAFPTTL